MKIGPGRNSNSVVRWSKIVGRHQIGCELDSRELHAGHLREGAGDERLREPRVVLDQDMAVGEEPEQDELQRVALPDHGALDLAQDHVAALAELLRHHQ